MPSVKTSKRSAKTEKKPAVAESTLDEAVLDDASDNEPRASWDALPEHTCGDFARLTPFMSTTQIAFSRLVARLLANPAANAETLEYICWYRCDDQPDSEYSDMDTDDDSPARYCGFFRLNMHIPPKNHGLGWVVGARRPPGSGPGAELQLTVDPRRYKIHKHQFRITRNLQTGVLMIHSDGHKIGIGDGTVLYKDPAKHTQPVDDYQRAVGASTVIKVGELSYVLRMTALRRDRQIHELITASGESRISSVTPRSFVFQAFTSRYKNYQFEPEMAGGKSSRISYGYSVHDGKMVVRKRFIDGLSPTLMKRDVNTLNAFSHPSIVKLREVIQTATEVSLILEPRATFTLADLESTWRAKVGAQPNEVFLGRLFRDYAAGLAHMHSKGWMHCDVKPENLGVTACDPAAGVILELGFALAASESTNTAAGTPGYRAPEMFRSVASITAVPLTTKVDVWALGITLLEMQFGSLFRDNPPSEPGFYGWVNDDGSVQSTNYLQVFKNLHAHAWRAAALDKLYGVAWNMLYWSPFDRITAAQVHREFEELFPREAVATLRVLGGAKRTIDDLEDLGVATAEDVEEVEEDSPKVVRFKMTARRR